MFPSKGWRVIFSARFFRGFGPVVDAPAAVISAQVRAGGPGGVIEAGFVWMVL